MNKNKIENMNKNKENIEDTNTKEFDNNLKICKIHYKRK